MPTAAAGPTGHGVGIGAAVGDEVDVRGLDRAVGVERHLHGAVLVARLARGEQVLAPVLDPLQRRADLRRREHQAHLVALDHDLLAEAAAGVAHHDPDAVLRHAEQARAEEPHLVRRLRRRVDRELAGRARVVDDQAARLPSAPAAHACW